MTLIVNRLGVGAVDVVPGDVRVQCTNTYAQVTAAGFLNGYVSDGGFLYANDVVTVAYGSDGNSLGQFSPSSSSGIWTLVPLTISDIALPTIANHLATYTNTSGGLGEDAPTAINGGNIQAGLSGTAGTLASFPATAAKGSLKVIAVANTGDTVTTISNVAMGQASVISIPDPAGATGKFALTTASVVDKNLVVFNGTTGLVKDGGARLIAGTTPTYGGGSTSNVFTVTGLASTCVGSAVIRASTNSVSVTKALPGTNTLTITFSSDPGAATTVDYIYATAALT